MTILYRRAWRINFLNEEGEEILTIQENTQTVNPPRLVFWVRQMIYIVNYMARFALYNLSPDTRAILQQARSVVFEAGYDGVMKTLHKGIIMNIFDLRQQPDYAFVVVTQDFFTKLNPIGMLIEETLTDRQAIKKSLESIPDLVIQDGNLRGLTDKPIEQRISYGNMTYIQVIEKLKQDLKINIWITNGVLYTCSTNPKRIVPQGAITIILNYLSGMIGSPQVDVANAGINVKSLLNGDLLPGHFVRVQTLAPQIQVGGDNFINFSQNQAQNGDWEIFAVDHYGDSRGDDWYSNVSAFGASLLFPESQS
jgi:hypothetical protein